MIEAFEIGVSLALRDGVSDGIVKAQRDMVALENALRTGGVSLRVLRDAAANALPVPVADTRGKVVEKPVARPGEALPAVVTRERDGDVETAGLFSKPMVPVGAAVAPVVVAARPTGQVDVPGGVALAVAQTRTAPLASPSAADSGRPDMVVVRDTGWPVLQSVHEAPLPAPAPAKGSASAQQVGYEATVVVSAERADRPRAPVFVAPPVQGAAPARDVADAPTAPSAPFHNNLAPVSERPVGQEFSGGREREFDPSFAMKNRTEFVAAAASSGGQSAPAAPPAPPRDAGPGGGDVFLDGMLVGRWMSRFLQREGERASAGPTGFDPRRGRLLPGVTVGG